VLVIGLILFIVAAAAAIILIGQNLQATVTVHALGHTWHWHAYWYLLAGLGIALVACLGVTLVRTGVTYARRAQRQTAKLRLEHGPLGPHLPDPDNSPFFAGDGRPPPVADENFDPAKPHRPRRGHHAA
jgi:hypothetical protein